MTPFHEGAGPSPQEMLGFEKPRERLYGDEGSRNFLAEWLKCNGRITLGEPVAESDWNQLAADEVLRKNPDGRAVLTLPKEGVPFWEMIPLAEEVDKLTLGPGAEKSKERLTRLSGLAEIMSLGSKYLDDRKPKNPELARLAEGFSGELGHYAEKILSRVPPEYQPDLPEKLGPDQLTRVDVWLATGLNLGGQEAESLMTYWQAGAGSLAPADEQKARVTSKLINPRNPLVVALKKGETIDERYRAAKLEQFFTILNRANERRGKSDFSWTFLEKIVSRVNLQTEQPNMEFIESILAQGQELLKSDMPWDPDNPYWQQQEKTLKGALHVDQLKRELAEVRARGDLKEIGAKEDEITDKIQSYVSRYGFEETQSSPDQMVKTQKLNCVGASLLGGTMLEACGIDNYLVAGVTNHSALLVATSDNRLIWRDMLCPPSYRLELTKQMFGPDKASGNLVAPDDIIEYSRLGLSQKLSFTLTDKETFAKILPGEASQAAQYYKWDKIPMLVYGTKRGHLAQVLSNCLKGNLEALRQLDTAKGQGFAL